MDKMKNINDPLWERIESLMKARNLSQKEFADEIGVKAVTITEWKKGKSRSYQKLATMRRIADALGVSVEELTQEKTPALKYEGEREDAPTGTMAEIIETARHLQPIQQEFLLAFLKTVVQNTPAENVQSQRSRTASQAAISAGGARANASIHP